MYFSDQLPLLKRHRTPKWHQIVCYDITKPVFKQLQKTTSPTNHATSRPEFVWVVGGQWVVPSKNLDHFPTISGNVRIMASVRIVGESINIVRYLKASARELLAILAPVFAFCNGPLWHIVVVSEGFFGK